MFSPLEPLAFLSSLRAGRRGRFCDLTPGDVLLHRFDLQHGVEVFEAVRPTRLADRVSLVPRVGGALGGLSFERLGVSEPEECELEVCWACKM